MHLPRTVLALALAATTTTAFPSFRSKTHENFKCDGNTCTHGGSHYISGSELGSNEDLTVNQMRQETQRGGKNDLDYKPKNEPRSHELLLESPRGGGGVKLEERSHQNLFQSSRGGGGVKLGERNSHYLTSELSRGKGGAPFGDYVWQRDEGDVDLETSKSYRVTGDRQRTGQWYEGGKGGEPMNDVAVEGGHQHIHVRQSLPVSNTDDDFIYVRQSLPVSNTDDDFVSTGKTTGNKFYSGESNGDDFISTGNTKGNKLYSSNPLKGDDFVSTGKTNGNKFNSGEGNGDDFVSVGKTNGNKFYSGESNGDEFVSTGQTSGKKLYSGKPTNSKSLFAGKDKEDFVHSGQSSGPGLHIRQSDVQVGEDINRRSGCFELANKGGRQGALGDLAC